MKVLVWALPGAGGPGLAWGVQPVALWLARCSSTLCFCRCFWSVLVRVPWRRQEQSAIAGNSPHMSCSPCPCSPWTPDLPVALPISSTFRGRGDVGSMCWGGGAGCRWSSPAPHPLPGFLRSSVGAWRRQGCGELTEAARPPFRIDEGSGGTGVALLAAPPAAGLQMGVFKWVWVGRKVWEEGSQSHRDSVTPLVPYLSRGADSCFLHSRFVFSSLSFFSFSLVFAPSEPLGSGDLGWVPGWGAGCILQSRG